MAGWWIHASMSVPETAKAEQAVMRSSEVAAPRQGEGGAAPAPAAPPEIIAIPDTPSNIEEVPHVGADPIAELRRHGLRVPLDGANVEKMKGGFAEGRSAGSRPHEAVDMLAPRMTPIHAVEDGTIAKLFFSKAGGTTIYQFDPSEHYCYYYAHLERYAAGLQEGQKVSKGEVIGYVGTTGNAPPNTPHLHFAVFELNADKHWWKGRPLDPYQVFKDRG
jgi:murein DD-endopeptidase MepM/ murein hydrolase activator NlpD